MKMRLHDTVIPRPWWHLLKYFFAGIFFGIVLIKSEIISWFRIQEMFRFLSFHMYGVMGSAVVTGIISVFLIKKFKARTIYGEPVKLYSKKFSKGQIYGGLLFGSGWALTGACPGPLFALIGSGLSVIFVVIGSAIAGTWWVQELNEEAAMKRWIDDMLQERTQEKRMPFTVIDKDGYTICGSTSFLNISFYDKRVEIGSSWLGTEFIGTGVNRQAKFALLCYAFEVMKMERVEVKTDNLNERAKAALLKVGMIPEGVLRSHMQMHGNRRRDSIYFSIIKEEWPERKALFFNDLV